MRYYCTCGCGHYLFVENSTITVVRDAEQAVAMAAVNIRCKDFTLHTSVTLSPADEREVAELLIKGKSRP